jgi:hypothetical protein
MATLLDAFGIVANVIYLGFFTAGMRREYKAQTARSLRKASQHYWTAAALAVIVLLIHLAAVPYDGWLSPAVNAFTLACCVACAVLADGKRDRMVIQEMQRDLGREL